MKVVFVLDILDDKPDDVLVIRSKAGDQDAFVILFLRCKGEVYTCLMEVVRNAEIAKDLWQDTYIKAWQRIQDLKEPSRFKPWLLTIARRLAFDWRKKYDPERTIPLEESTSDPIDYEADPQVMIEDAIDTDRVLAVLAKMEPVYREILYLYITGHQRAEIAEKLRYTEGTVTTYLSHARKQFRRLYDIMKETDNESGSYL